MHVYLGREQRQIYMKRERMTERNYCLTASNFDPQNKRIYNALREVYACIGITTQ